MMGVVDGACTRGELEMKIKQLLLYVIPASWFPHWPLQPLEPVDRELGKYWQNRSDEGDPKVIYIICHFICL